MNKVMTFLSAAGVVLALSASAGAQVNCGLVNKQLQMGRSVSEVAENLVVSEDDVKKCQSQGSGAATGVSPGGAAGSPPTGAAGSAPSGAAGSPPTGGPGSSSTGAQ